jgi:hypothetical protein
MTESSLRASDVDRQRVAERLHRAHDEGRISLLEFDERLAAAYAARTYAELAPLTSDLPSGLSSGSSSGLSSGRERRAQPPVRLRGLRRSCAVGHSSRRVSGSGWQLARRVQLAALVAAGLVNFAIWLAVSVGTGGAVYPWWIWVVGPWGLMLAAETVVARMLAGSKSPVGNSAAA